MAKLVYINTTFAGMAEIPLSPGQILYCADVPMTYYDTTNGRRVVFDKIKYCFSESDRANLPIYSLDSEYLYCVTSTDKFYRWSMATDWKKVTYSADIYDILDLTEMLVPTTITQNNTSVAPKTLATQVYTKDGEKVEDVLNDITRIGKTYRYIEIEEDGQREYDLPLPFANYFGLGNYIEVYIGSVWISPIRYSIIEDNSTNQTTAKLVFNEQEDVLLKRRHISIVYTYNTSRIKSGVYAGTDGHYIVDGTIPITKLAKYSSDYTLNDPTSVATNSAVYNSYEVLNSKLNAIAGNLIAHAISYNTGSELKADIDNFTLVDNSTIYLKLHTDIMPGATLSVNGGPQIPIYLSYNKPIKASLKAGDVLSITYSKMNNKFYANASVAYRLTHYSYVYDCQGGESTIVIGIEDFEPGYDALHVTHNNLKLIEGVNYRIDGHNLVLNYSTSEGDIIEMEIDKVTGNGLPVNGNTIMEPITFTDDTIFKNDVIFEGNIELPNGGSIDNNGNITIKENITAKQIIATVEDGLSPFIINSKTLVPNLNADMVDDYHAADLTLPDTNYEFIIDGESDIMDPTIQIMLRAFLGRVDTLYDRMATTDDTNVLTPTKNRYDEEYGADYDWPLSEPLSNENVRDTVEEVVYQLNCLLYKILQTESLEDLQIDLDDINGMSGDEISKDDYTAPTEIPLYDNWVDMANAIDMGLLTAEAKCLKAVSEDTSDEDIYKEYQDILDRIENWVPYDGSTEEDSDNAESSVKSGAFRALYIKTGNKRFYPITHRNAIVGLPFGKLATEKSVTELEEQVKLQEARITYLENVIEQLLSGSVE